MTHPGPADPSSSTTDSGTASGTASETVARRTAIGMVFDRTFPPSEVADYARRLEAGGVDELWVIEDCFFTTAPPLAAAALTATEHLTVGLGILPAVARTAAITAMEISTLARLAPGRVIGGIGHGVQSWMAQMGARTPSPVTTLEEVFTTVRALLRGETVSFEGKHVTLDGVTLDQPPSQVPPVIAGVRGPKSMAAAGRCADGVLLDSPCLPEYVEASKQRIGLAADGRTLTNSSGGGGRAGTDFRLHAFAVLCVTDDRARSHELIAPLISDLLSQEHPGLAAHPYYDEMCGINTDKGADGIASMPSDWWAGIGAIGTIDDAADYVGKLETAGVRSVSLFPAPDWEVANGQVDDVIALAQR